jgi:hypothetical protein
MTEPRRVKRAKTARWYAEKYGISTRTVRRIAAVPRAEWEANSIARAKPWEALGMSRATWYRKGKPLIPPTLPPQPQA